MYIHSSLTPKVLSAGANNLELLIISVSPQNSSSKLCVSLFDRPPSSNSGVFDNLCTALQSLNPSVYNSFVLLGDFNVNYFCTHSPLYARLSDCLSPFSLSQLVSSATHKCPSGTTSLIDLAFVPNLSQVNSCSVVPPLSNSDHYGIQLEFAKPSIPVQNPKKPRLVWRYALADFTKANETIESIDWDFLITDDVNVSLANWQKKYMSIMEDCIPRRALPKRRNLPWMSKKITQSIRKRNHLFKRAKHTNDYATHQKYKKMRNNVTTLLRNAKKTYMRGLDPYDKKKFWKTVKHLTKNSSSLPVLSQNGTVASSNIEKADMLNSFFGECLNHSLPPLDFSDMDELENMEECSEDLLCSVEEVQWFLEALDTTKANGPDGISAWMLKETALSIAPSVTKLFNLSIQSGCFPVLWKMSNVVPVPKSNDHSNPSNYRPISLLPILSKLLEHHIHFLISEYLSLFHPISNDQWGFQVGKSTVSALLATTYTWFQQLESGGEICAIFFDIKKAFDTVPHRALLVKLKQLNLNPTLIRWICSYLMGRKQKVVVEGETSEPIHVVSGVPQGSVLGPLLFIIYIDCINDSVLSVNSKTSQYADDMLLTKPVRTTADYADLQTDIDSLNRWVTENHLTFNYSKCKYMLISRKRIVTCPPDLKLEASSLERVQSYKYLGLNLTSNLSWSDHINSISTKAKKLVGLLYRRFYRNTDSQSLLLLYLALVRPHTEYASQVWNPHLQKDIGQLERVQKFALRMCAKQWDIEYTDLLNYFNLPSLVNRRRYLSLSTMYKIVHNLVYFPPDVFVPRVTALRSSSQMLYNQPFAHTNAFFHSFVPSTCSAWNNLPTSVTHANSISSFKSSLRNLL